jgi:hypothetical protein
MEAVAQRARECAANAAGTGVGAIYWRISCLIDPSRSHLGNGEKEESDKQPQSEKAASASPTAKPGKRDGPKGASPKSRLYSRAAALAAKVADADQGAVCLARLATKPDNWRLCVEIAVILRERFRGKMVCPRTLQTPLNGQLDWGPTYEAIASEVDTPQEIIHLVKCMNKRVKMELCASMRASGLTWSEVFAFHRMEPPNEEDLEGTGYTLAADEGLAGDPTQPEFYEWDCIRTLNVDAWRSIDAYYCPHCYDYREQVMLSQRADNEAWFEEVRKAGAARRAANMVGNPPLQPGEGSPPTNSCQIG